MSKTFASSSNGSKKVKGKETSSGNLELNITDIIDITNIINKEEINEPLPLIEKEEIRGSELDTNDKTHKKINNSN